MLFFCCFGIFLVLHRVPIISHVMLVFVMVTFLMFATSVANEYLKIQNQKTASTQYRR